MQKEIFCCCSPRDWTYLQELMGHLRGLTKQGFMLWSKADIGVGTRQQEEIDEHVKNAQLFLLLVSPAFMTDDYCGMVMERASERTKNEKDNVHIIPIILRHINLTGTLLDGLVTLPKSGKAVINGRKRDQVFADIAREIGEIAATPIAEPLTSIEINELRANYLQTLYDRYGRLDFKGIMHVEMHRPLTIPLEEVFVFPDLLIGIPEYETLRRDEEEIDKAGLEKQYLADGRVEAKGKELRVRREMRREARVVQQRETLPLALTKSRQIVMLGDPGSGKSTLLRYLILRLAQGKEAFVATFPQLADSAEAIPLHIPLRTMLSSGALIQKSGLCGRLCRTISRKIICTCQMMS